MARTISSGLLKMGNLTERLVCWIIRLGPNRHTPRGLPEDRMVPQVSLERSVRNILWNTSSPCGIWGRWLTNIAPSTRSECMTE